MSTASFDYKDHNTHELPVKSLQVNASIPAAATAAAAADL